MHKFRAEFSRSQWEQGNVIPFLLLISYKYAEGKNYFCYPSQREKMNNILNNLLTENPGNLRLFLSASPLPPPHINNSITLYKVSEIYPDVYFRSYHAPYRVCQCSYEC